MILDSNLIFDPRGTAITATAASTNIIDLGLTNGIGGNARDLGIGDDPALKLLILGNTLFAAAGAATLNIQFQGAPETALNSGTPGTYVTYAESGVLSIAQLNFSINAAVDTGTKLFMIDVPRPPSGTPRPRYYRLNYVVATGPFTAGAIEAYMVIGRDDAPSYPENFATA